MIFATCKFIYRSDLHKAKSLSSWTVYLQLTERVFYLKCSKFQVREFSPRKGRHQLTSSLSSAALLTLKLTTNLLAWFSPSQNNRRSPVQ